MKIFIGSLVIFFGTLLAAGLVALGQPVAMNVVPHAGPSASPGDPAPDNTGRSDESGWERLFAIRGLR